MDGKQLVQLGKWQGGGGRGATNQGSTRSIIGKSQSYQRKKTTEGEVLPLDGPDQGRRRLSLKRDIVNIGKDRLKFQECPPGPANYDRQKGVEARRVTDRLQGSSPQRFFSGSFPRSEERGLEMVRNASEKKLGLKSCERDFRLMVKSLGEEKNILSNGTGGDWSSNVVKKGSFHRGERGRKDNS